MLFEKIVEYFQENPIQSAIILALTAATAVIVVTLIILTAKRRLAPQRNPPRHLPLQTTILKR